MKLHFPHISRIFSALSLWILLLALVSFNVFLTITKPLAYADKVFQIFIHPFTALVHQDLAQTLWGSGIRTFADREFTLAAELSPVLGAATVAKEKQEESEISYWQNTVTTHPGYRDAYLQLAALTYRKGNLTQSHTYLLKAQELDPNNSTVNRLVDFTSKLLE